MAQLRQDYQKFIQRNTEIIAIGPEGTKSFADWWHNHQMPFIGIADPEHAIAKMYGQQVKLLKLGRMPASLLIDKNGYIRYKHFGRSMSDIPENQQVLSLIDRLNKEDTLKAQ
jgi:peroxiredoxin Q/BCP